MSQNYFAAVPSCLKCLFVFEILIQPATRTKDREQGRKN